MVGSVARKSTNILQTPQLFLIVENAPKMLSHFFGAFTHKILTSSASLNDKPFIVHVTSTVRCFGESTPLSTNTNMPRKLSHCPSAIHKSWPTLKGLANTASPLAPRAVGSTNYLSWVRVAMRSVDPSIAVTLMYGSSEKTWSPLSAN